MALILVGPAHAKCDKAQAETQFDKAMDSLRSGDLAGGYALVSQAAESCRIPFHMFVQAKASFRLKKFCRARSELNAFIARCGSGGGDACANNMQSASTMLTTVSDECSPIPKSLGKDAPDAASQYFAEARGLYFDKKYAEAAKMFDKALVQAPGAPILLRSLGHAHGRAESYDAAVKAYRAYLAKTPDAPDAATITKEITWLEGRIAATLKDSWPTLRFDSDQGEVAVLSANAERERLGTTPFTKQLKPGKYPLIFHRDGHDPQRRTILVTAGKDETIQIAMQRTYVAPPTNWNRIGAWSAIGAGALAAGLGGYFQAASADTAAEAEAVSPAPRFDATYAELSDRFDGEQLGAQVSYGLGVALIGTGVALLLLDNPPKQMSLQPGGAGVSWSF